MCKHIYSTLIFIFLFSLTTLNAQDYKSAVGLRLGVPLSLSYKTFINENGAIEGTVGTRGYNYGFGLQSRWVTFTIAYLHHQDLEIDGIDNLRYYYGAGLGAYIWTYNNGFESRASNTVLGLQAYGGIEYTFEDIPLSISADWVPTVFFSGLNSGFGAGYGALSARYTLKR